MLQLKNLKKHFGGIKAVDDCSFEVKENTITALIGPNGSGKTTIFNLISGILKTDEGKIFFKINFKSKIQNYKFQINYNDQNSKFKTSNPKQVQNSKVSYLEITNLAPEKISNLGISRIFQQSRLFGNLTVKENLLLALDNEDTKFWKNLLGLNKITKRKEEKIKGMLNLVGMEKFEDKLTRELSYGQKRLVELARTILNPHNFLMLDEPVAGVNPKLREKIKEILLKLKNQGETILLIEHDMNFTLKVSDWVIVMEKGKVIAEGKPEETKANPKVLEAYLGE